MKNEEIKAIKSQEEAFREKAGNYLVCFSESCSLRQLCLRWLVGQYAVIMKRGLTHLYLEMPGRMEYLIRQLLIQWWGRKKYFEARKGVRLITPEMQQDVADACRHHGWTGPIVYDGEEESWLW